MWKLFKAGIAYQKTLFIMLYTLLFGAAVLNAALGGLEGYLGRMMFFSIIAIGAVTGNEVTKYKMVRFETGLPIPIREVVFAGHLIWIIYWFSLMLILWLSSWIGARGQLSGDFFLLVASFMGSGICFVFSMGIFLDLRFLSLHKFIEYFLRGCALIMTFVFAAASLLLSGMEKGLGPPIRSFLSPAASVGLCVGGAAIAFLYFSLYVRRTSFVE